MSDDELRRHGLGWIADWLPRKHRDQLAFFFDGLHWWDFHSKKELREKMREVKAAYDEAHQLALDKGGAELVHRWDVAAGNKSGDDGKLHPDDFQARVYSCVFATKIGGSLLRPTAWTSEQKPVFFKMVDGRGHPDWKPKATVEAAVEAVNALLDEKGAEAFPARGGYPTALLEEAGERLDVSARTVRRRLQEAGWSAPEACFWTVKQ